ncbi:MAG: HAMP domain-containing protein [Candidatus Nealsonbacteria bacterium]|nr:HAMP domain-containing protein [Candidatus Nealsonbacteria bacterium]
MKIRIREKILGTLLIVALFSFLTTNLLWTFSTRSSLKEEILGNQKKIAQDISQRIREFTNIKKRNLILQSQTATILNFAELNKGSQEAYFQLSLLLRQDEDLKEVTLFNAKGDEIARMTPDYVYSPKELVSRKTEPKFIFPYFRYGLEYISPMYFSLEDKPMMTISVPIVIPIAQRKIEEITTIEPNLDIRGRKPGDILGVLSAEVYLGDVARVFKDIALGRGGYSYVVDEIHRIIIHPDLKITEARLNAGQADIIKRHYQDEAKMEKEGVPHPLISFVTGLGKSELGKNVLATHIHFKDSFGVVIEQPVKEAFAPISNAQRFAAILFLAGLFIMGLASLKMSSWLTRPIQQLRYGIEQIRRGDLSYRVSVTVKDEIGELTDAFNEMVKNLKESRASLEEEKDKTISIITNFSDGLLVLDKENKLFLINPRAENFFNIKSKGVVGKPFFELAIFPLIAPVISLVSQVPAEIFRQETKIKENLTIEVSTIPLIREKEKTGTLVVLHDITREKTVEKLKTEFVSLAAHQLRTPLSAIKWALKMLIEGDVGRLSKNQMEIVEKTYQSNERMVDLINDLLDVTRIEEGRYLFKPIFAEIEPIVQFVVNSYKEEAKRKKLILEFKGFVGKVPRVMVDVEKIRIAIQNLIDNAIKYTPPDGRVTVSLNYGKKELEVAVKDTGVGIPQDQRERVFSKFFRGVNAVRMETDGSGLGLFIAKNIIEAHDGKIWFESEEGKGTTFHFSLPVKEEYGPTIF